MSLHPDLATLYVTGSVLVTGASVLVLHSIGSAIGRVVADLESARRRGAARDDEPSTRASLVPPGAGSEASTV